jgi:hypothetical protein
MMSLWDALRMNMMISYQELVRTFPSQHPLHQPVAVAIARIAIAIVKLRIFSTGIFVNDPLPL